MSVGANGYCSIDLGDLPSDRGIWVAARIPAGHGNTISLRVLADGHEIHSAVLASEGEALNHPGVASVFGARRLLDIELAQTSGTGLDERLRQLGYDPADLPGATAPDAPAMVYAENARRSTTGALNALLIHESLRYGIACSATAFVATREEAGERVAGTVAVANALAHGWATDFLLPRMAMAAPAGAGPMLFDMAGAPAPRSMSVAAPPSESMAPLPPTPGTGSGRAPDLASLAGAPFEVARIIVSRLRGRATSSRPVGLAETTGGPGCAVRFSGRPDLSGAASILFDSGAAPGWSVDVERFTRLSVRITGHDGGRHLDSGLTLELFVEDLTAPRARVRLADVLHQGGERPLNVRYRKGQTARLVLRDANGVWRAGAPDLLVELR